MNDNKKGNSKKHRNEDNKKFSTPIFRRKRGDCQKVLSLFGAGGPLKTCYRYFCKMVGRIDEFYGSHDAYNWVQRSYSPECSLPSFWPSVSQEIISRPCIPLFFFHKKQVSFPSGKKGGGGNPTLLQLLVFCFSKEASKPSLVDCCLRLPGCGAKIWRA